MAQLIVDLTNVHIDEVTELKERLEADCWKTTELTQDERNGLICLINYVIDKRVTDKASSLSYTELLNLKSKIF